MKKESNLTQLTIAQAIFRECQVEFLVPQDDSETKKVSKDADNGKIYFKLDGSYVFVSRRRKGLTYILDAATGCEILELMKKWNCEKMSVANHEIVELVMERKL